MTAKEFMDQILDPKFIQSTWPAKPCGQSTVIDSQQTAQVVALVGKAQRGRPRKSKTTLRVWCGPLAIEFDSDNPVGAAAQLISLIGDRG